MDNFFSAEADHPAGTLFSYDTSGTFILNVIVESRTDKPFVEYLKDKLLRACGFTEEAWCVGSPDGYSWGGSGGQWTTRDLARLGQVYLNRGEVNGVQLLSRDFAEAAVCRQIDNNTAGHLDRMHCHGYGYQIWCMTEGCFRFLGMGGQVMFACLDLDLILAATSDEQGGSCGYSYLAELFYRYLVYPLRKETDASLPEDAASYRALLDVTGSLRCRLLMLGEIDSPTKEEFIGKTYRMDENCMGMEWFRVDLDGSDGSLVFLREVRREALTSVWGITACMPFPSRSIFGRRIRTPKGAGYRTMSGELFTEEHKLVIRSYLIDDYFDNHTTTLSFKGDEAIVYMSKTAEWFLEEYRGIGVGGKEK